MIWVGGAGMSGVGLLLQAVDMAGPLRWRWLLTDEQTGAPLADHRVDLDPGSDEVAAFSDLYEYARQHTVPDRRDADAARIVAGAGEWAGRALLGEQVGAAIARAAPVTVRVTAPDMAHFPAEPERFVGRAAAMAMASAALAPDSDRSTVLLHGMSGAGKTACALELAYRHQDSFAAAAFWQAPTRDEEFAGALASLAATLEIQLGDYGFTMTGHIGTAAALAAFLPRLRRVLEDSGVLLVLDNLETLLTPEGTWRDPRWEPLVTALTGHEGESRVILTSRVAPAGLGGSRVLTLPVHALSLDEAVALARELPNLRSRHAR